MHTITLTTGKAGAALAPVSRPPIGALWELHQREWRKVRQLNVLLKSLLQDAATWTAADRLCTESMGRCTDLQRQILELAALSHADLAVKIAIFDLHNGVMDDRDHIAESIIGDVRRLIRH